MWLQLSLTASKDQAPLIEALFENLGALSVTLGDAGDEPILEPRLNETPLWQATVVTALFEGERDADELCRVLNQALPAETARQLKVERIEDQVWERAWLDNFHPMRFGRRLWVCPSHQPPPADPDAVIVELDPGLAFGTGNHPTTALCLRWLDGAELAGRTVIDYGCGSGILAVAALRLGAREAIAIDHDPQALQATRDNAEKNAVAQHLHLYSSDQAPLIQTDIVLANILAGILIELEPQLAERVKPGGHIILSGILSEQAEQVIRAFTPAFEMRPPRQQEGWVLLEGVRRLG